MVEKAGNSLQSDFDKDEVEVLQEDINGGSKIFNPFTLQEPILPMEVYKASLGTGESCENVVMPVGQPVVHEVKGTLENIQVVGDVWELEDGQLAQSGFVGVKGDGLEVTVLEEINFGTLDEVQSE